MANEQTFPTGVRKRILRDGNGWNNPTNFIEDATRSGKRKRRLYGTQQKKTFSIKFLFTEAEYHIFDEWFENDLKHGLYSFYYPMIDYSGNSVTKIYRITKDGAPKYSNTSGKKINCTMTWEEM